MDKNIPIWKLHGTYSLRDWTDEDLKLGIQFRRECISQMLGTLYPLILKGEIEAIRNELDRRRLGRD